MKRQSDEKGQSKIVFADDVIIFVQNLKQPAEKMLELVSSARVKNTASVYKNSYISISWHTIRIEKTIYNTI